MSDVDGVSSSSVNLQRADDPPKDSLDEARQRYLDEQSRKAADAAAQKNYERAVTSVSPAAGFAVSYLSAKWSAPSASTPGAPRPVATMTATQAKSELEMLRHVVSIYGSVTPPKATTDRIA